MVSFLLSRCRERTSCDWILAASLDLITVAWLGVIVAWWL